MSGHFSSVVLNAYGAAREGLARAEERLALFPEPAILIAHIRSAEQEALGWLEGESFIPEQLAMNYGYSPRAWRRWLRHSMPRADVWPLPWITKKASPVWPKLCRMRRRATPP